MSGVPDLPRREAGASTAIHVTTAFEYYENLRGTPVEQELRAAREARMKAAMVGGTFITLVAASVAGLAPAQERTANLPYAPVHAPQFMSASDATFLNSNDRVIGVVAGRIAKAFPAAILIQHGLVEDRLPSGPIAVTW